MPKSATTHAVRRQLDAGQAVRDLDAEAVVAEEDVADPGDEHRSDGRSSRAAPRPRRGGSRGSGAATRTAPTAGSSSRVTATCSSPSTSLEHAGDGGRAAGEEEVVGVGPPGGAETDARCPCRPRPRRPTWCRSRGRRSASTPGSHHGQRLGRGVALVGSADGSPRVAATARHRAGAPRPRAACRRSGRRSPPPGGRSPAPRPSRRR